MVPLGYFSSCLQQLGKCWPVLRGIFRFTGLLFTRITGTAILVVTVCLTEINLLQGTVSKINQRDMCSPERETQNELVGIENVGLCHCRALHLALFCWAFTICFFFFF
jgi:hypothetical protein